MNAVDVIAWVGDGEVYCADCGRDDPGPFGLHPMFCGEDTDVRQTCAGCRCVIDGYNYIGDAARRRYIVTKPLYVSVVVEAVNEQDAQEQALLRLHYEWVADDPQPDPDPYDFNVCCVED